MRLSFFYIILWMFFVYPFYGQDVLVLMNGDSVTVTELNRTPNGKIIVSVLDKKGRIKKVDFYPAEIFSVISHNGKEEVWYQSTDRKVLGMDLTPDNVRKYIQGEAYAKKNYRFVIGKVVNFVAGVVAPFVSTYVAGSIIFAPLLPLTMSTVLGYTGPSSSRFDKRYAGNGFDKYFKEGYLVAGRFVRINKGVKSGLVGFVVGITGYVIAVKFL